MKYVNVANTSTKEIFELWEDEEMLADISFSKHTRFVRMVSDLGRRMFSFEKKGFLNPRKVIRNEYGFKLGKIVELKNDTGTGIVEMNGKRYFFEYDKNNSGELIVYDEFQKNNLLTCSFNALALGISKTKCLLDSKFASLLLMLCWYSFQSHTSTTKMPL